jgi:hypothetical protein
MARSKPSNTHQITHLLFSIVVLGLMVGAVAWLGKINGVERRPASGLQEQVPNGSWVENVEENFENMTAGVSFDARPHWIFYYYYYGSATAEYLAGSMMGRLYAYSSSSCYLTYTFSSAGNYSPGVKMEFDMAAGATNMQRTIYISPDNSLADYWSIYFKSTGTIAARHGSSTEVILQTYTANTRYHIKVEFVGNMHTLDVTINGTKYTNGGSHFSTYAGTATFMQQIRISSDYSGAGWIAVDNIDGSWFNISYPDEPSITHPADLTYTAGQTGKQISWILTDVNASSRTYAIYCNSSSIASNSWTSGMTVTQNVTGLPIGSYNYTIVANDGLGHSAQDTVIVNVIANQAPTITQPSNITYTMGYTGNYIYWTITDTGTSTRSFTVSINGSSPVNGTWTSGSQISWNINGLVVGSYNYTIYVTDGLGLSVRDEVIVRVLNGIPTIYQPGDITYTYGIGTHSIGWYITDLSTIVRSYAIYVNGSWLVNGTWTSSSYFYQSVDNIPIGSYNYTVVGTDGYGGTVKDTVIVKVMNGIPSITNPADKTSSWNEASVTISWTITDASTTTRVYTIYVDGHVIASGLWTSGMAVTYNFDSLAPAKYNITIVVIDGYGARIQDQVWFTRSAEQGSTYNPFQAAAPGIALTLFESFGACLVVMLIIGGVISSKHGIGKPAARDPDGQT